MRKALVSFCALFLRYSYSLLLYLMLPWLFLRLLFRSRHTPAYRTRWAERLGFAPRLAPCLWVHAVSMGEVQAAHPLIKAWQTDYPTLPILVTTVTPTGAAYVAKIFADSVQHAYLPYDTPDAVRRFLQRTKPRIGVILETELWPNLLAACHKAHVPLLLANACLSEKSVRGFKRIMPVMEVMWQALSYVAVQGELDAARFRALGLPAQKIVMAGNLKYDLVLPENITTGAHAWRQGLGDNHDPRFIWVAASTHAGEEAIVLAAHHMLLKSQPNALLILVPRHPERFIEVANTLREQGFAFSQRSLDSPVTPATVVYLGDTMGELLQWYAASDVALVGGSFASVGGHNLLEPAMLQKPIITGPDLYNITDVRDHLLAFQGLWMVEDTKALADAIQRLAANPTLRATLAHNAYRAAQVHRGAVAKVQTLVQKLLRR